MKSTLKIQMSAAARTALGITAFGLALSACSSITDNLLTAETPGIIPPVLTQTAAEQRSPETRQFASDW